MGRIRKLTFRLLLGVILTMPLATGCTSLDETASDDEPGQPSVLEVLRGTEYGGVSRESREIERSLSRARVE